MENILQVHNIDHSKYFFSSEKEEDHIIKIRIGYYFNKKNKQLLDPENLFIKLNNLKFHSFKDNKIKFKLEDENTIEYFKILEKKIIDELKTTGLLTKNKVKKYAAFINKNSDDITYLTVNMDNSSKLFTKLKTNLTLSELEENTDVKAILELESILINKSDPANMYSCTNLVLKRLLSLKHIPLFIEKDLPPFPFTDDENTSSNESSSESRDDEININDVASVSDSDDD